MADPMKKSEGAMSPKEFFKWAERQDQPYELIEGVPRPKWLADDGVTMMAGESPQHTEIQVTLTEALNGKLREKGAPCFAAPYGVDVTLAAGLNKQGKSTIVYPDAVVDCGYKTRTDETRTAVSPIVVCEILSPSNRGHDMGDKLDWYQRTPGVENIVYIEQHEIFVRLYVRYPDGTWIKHVPLTKLTDILSLPALDISLTLVEFYEVVFGT